MFRDLTLPVAPHHQPAAPPAPASSIRPPALGDLRLVDFTRAFAGPLATMFLGFFGAEVIKIESADLEDNRTAGDPNYPELHRTKLSCTIDARQAEGQALVKRLLAKSGIVVENFRPGVMDRLHLSYDELRAARPDVIMLAMPGFGNTGPLRDYYSYGQQGHDRPEPPVRTSGVAPHRPHEVCLPGLRSGHHWRRHTPGGTGTP